MNSGLPSWVKTSGSKGFHIVVPLDGKADIGEVARFAHAVGTFLVKRDPQHLTQEFSKADRGGRILVDTGRNGYSATFAAAYAVRAKPGAPVSAPCTWEEIERGEVGPRTFTLRTMAAPHRRGRRSVNGHAKKAPIVATGDRANAKGSQPIIGHVRGTSRAISVACRSSAATYPGPHSPRNTPIPTSRRPVCASATTRIVQGRVNTVGSSIVAS